MSILHPSSKKISFLLHQLGRAVEQTHTHQITLKFKNFSAAQDAAWWKSTCLQMCKVQIQS